MKKKHIILLSSIGIAVVTTAVIVTAVLLPRANSDDSSSSIVTSESPNEHVAPSTSVTQVFTITWNNYDGTTLKIDEDVAEGTLPTYTGVAPVKASNVQFSYTFDKWSPDVVLATSDATYTAQFNEEVNRYAVVWQDHDGTLLKSHTVAYGTLPEYGSALPTRAKSAEFTYTFAQWSPEVVKVTGNATYKAIYTETRNNYTVTWLNHDGSELQTDIAVPYGTLPTYDDVDPTKEGNAQSYYTFSGWSPAVTAVTGDATYTATFTPRFRSFNINLDLNGGTFVEPTTPATISVEYGAAYTLPLINSPNTTPFGGWYYNDEIVANEFGVPQSDFLFTEDITLVAAFYYPIYTRSDLVNISQNLTGTYRLMNDLDLSDEEWVPLSGFAGDFNGQNFTISGMTITTYQESVGLFGEVNEATISNIMVSESRIAFETLSEPGNLYIGGVVGSSLSSKNLTLSHVKHENATIDVAYRRWGTFALGGLLGNYVTQSAATLNITESSNSSPIEGGEYNNTGGLVGRLSTNNATITISNSFNSGDMSINLYSGGLIGDVYDKSSTIILNNTYNTGTINGYAIVGGLIGQMQTQEYSNVTINNSYNKKDIITPATNIGGLIGLYNAAEFAELNINKSYNEGNISGEEKLGGLVGTSARTGQKQFFPEVHIKDSYNLGDVSGTRGTLGGLVGQGNNYMTITNSYNKGAVSADREYAAGLVGWTQHGGAITNSINFGDVTSTTVAGSIIGRNHENAVIITNSFFTNVVCNNNGQPFVGATPGGTYIDITTLDATFFSDTLEWDNEVWDLSNTLPSNALYPILK